MIYFLIFPNGKSKSIEILKEKWKNKNNKIKRFMMMNNLTVPRFLLPLKGKLITRTVFPFSLA